MSKEDFDEEFEKIDISKRLADRILFAVATALEVAGYLREKKMICDLPKKEPSLERSESDG